MNNSWYLQADRKKNGYTSAGNLRFFLGECRRFDPKLVLCMLLSPIPHMAAGLLGSFLPAVLVGGIEAGWEFSRLMLSVLAAGAGYVALSEMQYLLSAYYYQCRMFLGRYLTGRFVDKMQEIDYDRTEEWGEGREAYDGAWNSANNARGFYDGAMLLPQLLIALGGALLTGTILGSRSILLLALVLVSVAVNLWLLSVARKVHRKYYGKISGLAKGVAYIGGIATDSASGKDIRIYRMLDFILRKYDENLREMGKHYSRIHNWYLFRNASAAVLGFVRNAAAWIFLIGELVAGRMSAAEFVFLLGVIDGLVAAFENLLRAVMGWNTLDASVSAFRQFLDMESRWRRESAVDPGTLEKMRAKGVKVELRDVTFTYRGAEKPVIEHFNLKIEQGEKIALIGLNGAGKTTLVKLICGLYRPDEGEILLNGIPQERFTKEEYTSLISVMFQDATFLPLSLDENLTAARAKWETFDEEKLDRALALSGFRERYERLADRGRTRLVKKLEDEAVDFSGGEKQKLVFARAIYRDAPLMILDEPTAALDPIAENELYQNLGEAAGERTVIYISHRLASTRFCDWIVLIEDGGIVEQGTHDELMAWNDRYAALYEMQSRYYHEEKERERKRRIMEGEADVSVRGEEVTA